jgi:hypothetical protein
LLSDVTSTVAKLSKSSQAGSIRGVDWGLALSRLRIRSCRLSARTANM